MTTTTEYGREEVSKHNGKDGNRVWVIIKESVYDLTDYLDEHPGGGDLIEEWAGKDGTKAFQDFGHSGDAKSLMKKYKIGELIEADRKQTKKPPTVKNASEKPQSRSCLNIVTCGLIG